MDRRARSRAVDGELGRTLETEPGRRDAYRDAGGEHSRGGTRGGVPAGVPSAGRLAASRCLGRSCAFLVPVHCGRQGVTAVVSKYAFGNLRNGLQKLSPITEHTGTTISSSLRQQVKYASFEAIQETL